MKKLNMKRIMTFLLAMVIAATTIVTVNPSNISAANVVSVSVVSYNHDVVAKEGEPYSELVKRLQPMVKAQIGKKVKTVPIDYLEKGQYVTGKYAKINFVYNGIKADETIKVKVKVTTKKLSVSVKSKFYEGQKLTKKLLKVIGKFSDGSTNKNFKGYKLKNENKPIKAKKFLKVKVSSGKKSVTKKVKVVPIKRLIVLKTFDKLEKGTKFDSSRCKEVSVVKAEYVDGKKKTLDSYSVSANSVVEGNYFTITYKYGSFEVKRSIPVVTKPAPAPAPTPTPVQPTPEPKPPVVKTVEVSASVEGEGSALVNGKRKDVIKKGSEATWQANAKEGYEFKGWKLGNKMISTESVYTVIVNEDMALVAVFEKVEEPKPETVEVSASVEGGGTAVVNGKIKDVIKKGSEATWQANAKEGYEFKGWKRGTEMISTESVYTAVVNEDMALVAVFEKVEEPEPETVEVSASVEGEGSALVNGKRKDVIKKGSEATWQANAKEGYEFKGWKRGTEMISTESVYTAVVNEDMALVAVFEKVEEPEPETVEVSASVEGEGSAMVNGKEKDIIEKGSEATWQANAKEGHEFKGWKLGNKMISTESVYTVAVNEDMTLVAVFEKIQIEHKVTIENDSEIPVKVNGKIVHFTDKTADFNFGEGIDIDISVTDSESERYVHLVDKDTMQVLSEDYTYTHTVTKDITIVVVVEPVCKVTVIREGAKCKASLAEDELIFVDNKAEVKLVAGRYPLEILLGDDYNFNGVVDETGKTLTTNLKSEISVISNMTITLKFSEKEKFVSVTFKNIDGQIYATESIAVGESMIPPTDNMQRPNQIFDGWVLDNVLYSGTLASSEFLDEEGNSLDDAIKRKTAARENVEIFSHYVEEEKKIFTVTVKGERGLVRKYGEETEGVTRLEVEDGTRIVLLASEENFGGWYNANTDTLVAQTAVYDKYTVHSDVEFEVRYSDEPIKPEPRVYFFGNQIEVNSDKYSVYIANDIPSEVEKVEWGIIFTTNDAKDISEEMMTVEMAEDSDIIKKAAVDNSKVTMTIASKLPATSMTKKFRVYAIIKNATGKTETIYSEVLEQTF